MATGIFGAESRADRAHKGSKRQEMVTMLGRESFCGVGGESRWELARVSWLSKMPVCVCVRVCVCVGGRGATPQKAHHTMDQWNFGSSHVRFQQRFPDALCEQFSRRDDRPPSDWTRSADLLLPAMLCAAAALQIREISNQAARRARISCGAESSTWMRFTRLTRNPPPGVALRGRISGLTSYSSLLL